MRRLVCRPPRFEKRDAYSRGRSRLFRIVPRAALGIDGTWLKPQPVRARPERRIDEAFRAALAEPWSRRRPADSRALAGRTCRPLRAPSVAHDQSSGRPCCVAASALVATQLGGSLTTDQRISNNPDYARGDQIIAERFDRPDGVTELVIVQSEASTVDESTFRTTGRAAAGRPRRARPGNGPGRVQLLPDRRSLAGLAGPPIAVAAGAHGRRSGGRDRQRPPSPRRWSMPSKRRKASRRM